jgi:hypothetical protein
MNRDIDATRYVHMSIIYSTSCLCPAYIHHTPTYHIPAERRMCGPAFLWFSEYLFKITHTIYE